MFSQKPDNSERRSIDMGKVSTGFSMSLDGFVAGPQDDVSRLSQWMTSGDIDITVSTGDRDIELKVPSESADMFQGANKQIGALVAGRRLFDLTGGYGGQTSPGRTSAIEPRQNGSSNAIHAMMRPQTRS